MFAALGRIYDRNHLLSLERIKYYIQVVDFCQHLNIIFCDFYSKIVLDVKFKGGLCPCLN